MLTSNRAQLTQELNDGNDQAAQTDGAEAIREGTSGGSTRSSLGELSNRAKVPRGIEACYCGVNCVLEPLQYPVHGEGDKDDQTNDLGFTAALAAWLAVWIILTGLIRDVDGCQSDREPGRECNGNDAADERYHVHVAVLLAHIDGRSEHKGREGDTRDPCPEGKRGEPAQSMSTWKKRVSACM